MHCVVFTVLKQENTRVPECSPHTRCSIQLSKLWRKSRNFENSEYLSARKYDGQWNVFSNAYCNESVKKELFCLFLMTILSYQMNDNYALPAPWCGFSGITKMSDISHKLSGSSHTLWTTVNMFSRESWEPLLSNMIRHSYRTDLLMRASHYAKWPPPRADLQHLPALILTQNDSTECQLVQPADTIKTAL